MSCAELEEKPVLVTAGGGSDMIRVWDLETGDELRSLSIEQDNVHQLSCTTNDGRPMAFIARGSSLDKMDLTTGSLELILSGQQDTEIVALSCVDPHESPITVFGRNRRNWFANHEPYGGDVVSWDPAFGERSLCDGLTAPVLDVAASLILGRPVAVSGHADGGVRIWDLAEGVEFGALSAGKEQVDLVGLGVLHGTMVVAAAHGAKVWVWDTKAAIELASWTFPYSVAAMAFGPSGELVVATGHEVVVLELKPTSLSI